MEIKISETHDVRKDVEMDALVSHAAIWCARCARLVRTAAGVVTPAGGTLCRGESDAERRVREIPPVW